MDMKDIRPELFYHAKAFQVQRVGDAVAVNALQRDGRAVQHAALYIVFGAFWVQRDDKHLMPVCLQHLA